MTLLSASQVPVKFVAGDSEFHELDLNYIINYGGQPQGLRWAEILDELTNDFETFPYGDLEQE